MDKKNFREMIKQKLSTIDEHTYQKWSSQIANELFQSKDWKKANTIGITISRGREVDTTQIIEQAWKEGKNIAVPKCYPNDKQMKFRYIRSFNQLESVYFGLLEPIIRETEPCEQHEIDLLIVPGIVFDQYGYRIGYGGGYYDRYLTSFEKNTLSLAFSCQMVDKVPTEKHDIRVSKIVTEQGMILCQL